MAPEKSPCFQFYPRDYISDPRVKLMTLEQRGLYWDACCLCWLEGSLPADPAVLARLFGVPNRRFLKIWPEISECFQEKSGKLFHKRLDAERKSQAEHRERRQDAARKRWEKQRLDDALQMQSNATEPKLVDAMQCSSSASSSASSTAVKGARVSTLIPRRDLNAFLQGPVFSIPQKWADKALAAANGKLTEAQLTEFAQALFDRVEANREDVGAHTNFLGWLDEELRAWRGAAVQSGPSAVEMRHAAKLAAIEAGAFK